MFLRKLRIALGLVVGIGVLLSGAILLQYQVRAEPTPDDKAQLQGAWQAVSAERDGRQAPEDYVTSIKPVFTGDRMTMPSRGLGETQQASFKLDPSAKPKAIDITIGGEGKMLGIYELTKDTLKLCLAEPGNERPKEFAGKGKQVLVVLQRAARTGRDEE